MKYNVGSIIAKVSSMCNLNCSYCYVFNRGDKHYHSIPKKMSKDLCEQLLLRIREHCLDHQLTNFTIVFHGGEPLLLGVSFYEEFLAMSSDIFKETNIRIAYLLQTNGTLMNDNWAKFFVSNDIHVGFSIDGYESIHNENRIYKTTGKGSYIDVVRGMNIYSQYAPINVLSVVNTKADPLAFYQTFKELGLNSFSLLFQDANYKDNYGVDIKETTSWMIRLFDIWFDDKNKKNIKFLNPYTVLINLLLGLEEVGNDAFGEVLNSALLILTNGEIQVTGVEKSSETDHDMFNLKTHKIDDVFQEKIFRDYYDLHKDNVLCEFCQKCLIKPICGGGRLSHRYSEKNGFNNPTIYCDTMKQLVVHIQNRLLEKLPEPFIKKTKLEPLKIEEL